MTRYTVEYRRWCKYSQKLRERTIYSTHEKKQDALESYARHVSSYPAEQARLVQWPDEPDETLFFFDPSVDEDEEEAA